jgi:hypothetical protein
MEDYRISFRIQPNDHVEKELERLASILSRKYKKEVNIYLREGKKR